MINDKYNPVQFYCPSCGEELFIVSYAYQVPVKNNLHKPFDINKVEYEILEQTDMECKSCGFCAYDNDAKIIYESAKQELERL